jgi:hypothetical protein
MAELIEDTEIDGIKIINVETQDKSRHYIDDEALTAILSEWSVTRAAAIAAGQEATRLPDSVARSIMDMSDALGKRFNFSQYSYLDEMKSDAILHCVKYIHNFNPNKKSEKKGKVSAFGYINMIIWRSFTHRIVFEKREQYFKYKSFQLMGGAEAFKDEDMDLVSGEDGESGSSISALGADFLDKIAEYEERYMQDKIKKDKKAVAFDNFMFAIEDASLEADDELVIDFEDQQE